MADDRGFLEKLLKPTEEEKEDVKKKLEQAFQTQRGMEKYGYGEFLEKIVEEQILLLFIQKARQWETQNYENNENEECDDDVEEHQADE